MSSWTFYFDGACPGGVPTCGIFGTGEFEIESTVKVRLLGEEQTTNVAEYGGLIEALQTAKLNAKPGDKVLVRGDSQLVIRHMSGQYKLRKLHLKPYLDRARELVSEMKGAGIDVTLEWIPREKNTQADRLSKTPL